MSDIPTKEIGELMEVMSDKIPKLVNELIKSLYSEQAGTQMGLAVGHFYKGLVDAGIPPADALEMAKDYIGTLKSVASSFSNN